MLCYVDGVDGVVEERLKTKIIIATTTHFIIDMEVMSIAINAGDIILFFEERDPTSKAFGLFHLFVFELMAFVCFNNSSHEHDQSQHNTTHHTTQHNTPHNIT